MIPVVGSPAKGQFGKVAGTDHQTVFLVGYVHQDLSAFAGLAVFVGHVMNRWVVTDIFEMLEAGILDGDFL